jgi:hypothetical protein
VAVFDTYIDESKDTADKMFIVGGFVGMHEAWESLEPLWIEALPKYLRYFHATECFSGSEQFSGIHKTERTQLLNRLTDIIADHDIRLIGCGLRKAKYEEFAPAPKTNEFLGNRYLAPFLDCMGTACEYAISPSPPTIPEKTAHICHFFIEGSEYSDGAKRLIRETKTNSALWWRIAIGTDSYGDKEGPAKITLLQVADLGAFLFAKKIGSSRQGVIPWQAFYDKLEKARKILKAVEVTDCELEIFYRQQSEEQSSGC